jgi:predicted glycosyltransferase
MRILFDIVHPAHVHFFKHMIRALRERGHETAILARDKDVTSALLDHYGLTHDTVGRPSRHGRLGQLLELVHRDLVVARLARSFGADIIATRNPAGVQGARLAGALGIFDTDDGSAAGIHFHAARPFAHYLTSPDCLPERWGRRHVLYPGYKQSAYLHPDHFTPDPTVLSDLGLSTDEPFFVVRFVAMDASHDKGEDGMSHEAKRAVLLRLQKHGRVFLSCESKVPDEWAHLAYQLAPHRLHDLLAFASIFVGDSQTMAAEAAYLGTPALRCSSFAGRLSLLDELEHRYGLTWAFPPDATAALLKKLDELLARTDVRSSIAEGRARMLSKTTNVAVWFTDFIESCARAPR